MDKTQDFIEYAQDKMIKAYNEYIKWKKEFDSLNEDLKEEIEDSN